MTTTKKARAEAQHTPGPWRALPAENGHERHIDSGDRNGIIATINLSRGGLNAPAEGNANARAIAEVPAMLILLTELLEIWDTDGQSPDALENALGPRMSNIRTLLACVEGR